jgi:hypothetical protein
VHILGQKGQTDSLTDYQCTGEKQPGFYYYDQNGLDWSGNALLFTQAQLDSYKAAHPDQNVRVFAIEDDDTACQIKTSPSDFQRLITIVDSWNNFLAAGKDTAKHWTFAEGLLKLLSSVASFINTNDELVGNAVKDSVAAEYHAGFNWVVKGDNNATNGWIKLEMR